jgi:cell division septation protein DedD
MVLELSRVLSKIVVTGAQITPARARWTRFARGSARWALLVAFATLGVGCAHHPMPAAGTGDEGDDATGATEQQAGGDQDHGYSLDDEGESPPPGDVAFEEDKLIPPEDVEGAALTQPPVNAGPADDIQLPEEERVAPTVPVPTPPTNEAPVPQSEGPAAERGFRVQLVAAGSREDAERIAREARTRLAVPVYVEFESPFYKVRAGDFTDRAQALQLRDRARSYGYPEAWVVTTTIRSPQKG